MEANQHTVSFSPRLCGLHSWEPGTLTHTLKSLKDRNILYLPLSHRGGGAVKTEGMDTYQLPTGTGTVLLVCCRLYLSSTYNLNSCICLISKREVKWPKSHVTSETRYFYRKGGSSTKKQQVAVGILRTRHKCGFRSANTTNAPAQQHRPSAVPRCPGPQPYRWPAPSPPNTPPPQQLLAVSSAAGNYTLPNSKEAPSGGAGNGNWLSPTADKSCQCIKLLGPRALQLLNTSASAPAKAFLSLPKDWMHFSGRRGGGIEDKC